MPQTRLSFRSWPALKEKKFGQKGGKNGQGQVGPGSPGGGVGDVSHRRAAPGSLSRGLGGPASGRTPGPLKRQSPRASNRSGRFLFWNSASSRLIR